MTDWDAKREPRDEFDPIPAHIWPVTAIATAILAAVIVFTSG